MNQKKSTETLIDREEFVPVFEERAENLSKEELNKWTQFLPNDEKIMQKIMGTGSKLLIGPRGSGKSTFLRMAYFKLVDEDKVLVAYINYSKSMYMEPLLYKRSDALIIFRQWVLYKIIVGLHNSLVLTRKNINEKITKIYEKSKEGINLLEKGGNLDEFDFSIGPSELIEIIEEIRKNFDYTRTVLLMDDAAHAFSPLQQKEFFEIFKELRTRTIALKAAVYPGVTSYAPNFHIGHEAEKVEIWYDPYSPKYLQLMKDLLKNRLPDHFAKLLNEDITDFLALASFGLPRSFLNMISSVLTDGVNKNSAEEAVKENAQQLRIIFDGLSQKFPRYSNFLMLSKKLEQELALKAKNFNKEKETKKKKVTIAIKEEDDVTNSVERIINLMQYIGLIRKKSLPISRGPQLGRYQRYDLHSSILFVEGSYSLGKSASMKDIVNAMSDSPNRYLLTQMSVLLGKDFKSRCQLSLPPCHKCSERRISEQQLYCMKCGAPLIDASIHNSIISTPIEKLPIPSKKIESILNYTTIRTIQDILLDDESQQLTRARTIGPIWRKRIMNLAEEYVSV